MKGELILIGTVLLFCALLVGFRFILFGKRESEKRKGALRRNEAPEAKILEPVNAEAVKAEARRILRRNFFGPMRFDSVESSLFIGAVRVYYHLWPPLDFLVSSHSSMWRLTVPQRARQHSEAVPNCSAEGHPWSCIRPYSVRRIERSVAVREAVKAGEDFVRIIEQRAAVNGAVNPFGEAVREATGQAYHKQSERPYSTSWIWC